MGIIKTYLISLQFKILNNNQLTSNHVLRVTYPFHKILLYSFQSEGFTCPEKSMTEILTITDISWIPVL